jgi:hypothetical protein
MILFQKELHNKDIKMKETFGLLLKYLILKVFQAII